ncbi:ribosome maturation factor RimP [Facklamia sp. P13055]|uniref:ribosome maturation factor RimP n=1 Tax=unclassified Facklamia TaxID=2622293 RepID=UPI003D186B11
MSIVIDKVQPLVEPIIASLDCQLIDIEYLKEGKHWFLRIYADKEGGIDLDHCALISEKISEVLDTMQPDPFPEAYFLEVSSPGAERPLKNEEQIRSAIGEYVHFDYYAPQYGEKQHEGVLLDVTEDYYLLKVPIKTVTKELEINKKGVAKARLAVKF